MSSQSYFQCLVCQSLFPTLWKVERHIKLHDNDEIVPVPNQPSSGPCRRRGMLPIQKVMFYDCFVPVVKNQIDPDFLANYSGLQANDTDEANKRNYSSNNSSDGIFDNLVDNNEDESLDDLANGVRRSRRSTLRARNKIRQAAQILTIPHYVEEDGDKDNEMEFIENLMQSIPASGYYSDDDFIPNPIKTGGKRGRPYKHQLNSTHLKKSKQKKRKKSSPRRHLQNDIIMEDGSGDHPWKCEHCPKSYSQQKILAAHISTDHAIPCPIPTCQRRCTNFVSLQPHLRFHDRAQQIQNDYDLELSKTEDKPYVKKISSHFYCKYCLEKQTNYESLQKHLMIDHKSDTNLKCPCCDRTFDKALTEFIAHIKIFHADSLDPLNERAKRSQLNATKEKRYKCDRDQCDRSFVYKFQLKNHKENHDKVKKQAEADVNKAFSCPVCKKGFNYKDNLRRHFTLHLENNPFVCDFPKCNRRFNSDYNLRRHKGLHYESVIKAERINCPICNAVISRRDKLPRHIRMYHKPSDINITNGVPNNLQNTKTYFPPTSRIPRFPRYDAPESTSSPPSPVTPDFISDSRTSSPMPLLLAEDLDDTAIKFDPDEIHLVDKILIDPSGEAIHLKGEVLQPQAPTAIYRNRETPPKLKPQVDPYPAIMPTKMKTSLSTIIANDPVYKKFEFAKAMLITKRYNYTKNKTYACLKCKAVFTRAWTLQLHLKSIHNTTILEENKLLRSSNLDLEGDETPQVTLMCGKCAYVAEDASDLQRHMDTAPDHGKRIKCTICGLSFDTKIKLKKHTQTIHHGARNFPCKFCNKSFTTLSYLKFHEKRVHNNSHKVVKKECPVCLRMICNSTMRGHLQRHKFAGQKAERFKCMLCLDTFSAPEPLRRHIDCVHLGKPLNQRRKGQRRGEVTEPLPPGTGVRRGPKRAGDEWFHPLLEGLGLGSSKSTKDKDTEKLLAEKVDEVPQPVDELSILGF